VKDSKDESFPFFTGFRVFPELILRFLEMGIQ